MIEVINRLKNKLKLITFPCYRQLEENDCGPTCIQIICAFYGKKYSINSIKDHCNTTRLGVSIQDIISSTRKLGFNSKAIKITFPNIKKMPLPAILYWQQKHFVVLYNIAIKKRDYIYYIIDPNYGKIKINRPEFEESFFEFTYGIAILLEPTIVFYESKYEKHSKIKEFNNIFSTLKNTFVDYRKKIFMALILAIVAMVINWLMPFFFQKIIDDGIELKNLSIIKVLAIAQFVLFVSYVISNNLSNIILSKIGFNIGINLLSDYLYKLIQLPISFFDKRTNSDLIQLVDDQEHVKTFLIYNLIRYLFSFSNLIVFSCILLFYNRWIFLFFLLFGFFSVLWSSFFLKKRKVINYMQFSALSEGKNNIYELINGMKEIKINTAQNYKLSQIKKTQDKINALYLKSLLLNYYNTLGVVTFNKLKDIIVIVMCANFVISDEMTIGALMTISYILGQLGEPFDQMMEFLRTGQDAKISFYRLLEIQANERENDERINLLSNNISSGFVINNISFKYAGASSKNVIENVNICIPSGKLTAIVGESGSGKTTLLKLLLSFYYPQNGNIYLDGLKMSAINTDDWRKRCGVVMQDGYIFSGTIQENIAIADEKPDLNKLQTAAKIACIDTFIETLPMKFNTKIGNYGIDLSGGQKQRILIDRAVYKNPECIFFDEATSFLDTKNEALIIKNIKLFFKGKTVIIIAHRLSTVKDADNIIVLDKGHVIENGSHEQLIAKRGTYYTLIKNQLELGD